MAAYADYNDLTKHHSEITIGQLISTSGVTVPPTEFNGNEKIEAALDSASGEIESALILGKRYDPDDLATLTGNSQARLKQITCLIAMANLYDLQPGFNEEQAGPIRDRADKWVERLRRGENVFNLADTLNATQPDVDGPSTPDYADLQLLRDRSRRYYPARRLPRGR